MFYFAYGSNMSMSRLQQRVPSATRVGACTLYHHDLRFHKKGRDGSSKCDAFHTGNADDFVVGSLFRMNPAEKLSLDSAEGLGFGYEEKYVSLVGHTGEVVEAVTYYATAIEETLKPYSWYLLHVLIGAYESGCPYSYVSRIKTTETVEDRNLARDARERAIHV